MTDSFAADVFRDSHEKGLVSFLAGAAGAGSFDVAGADGGGDHGTEGSAPDSPISEDVMDDDLDGSGGFFSGSVVDKGLAFGSRRLDCQNLVNNLIPFETATVCGSMSSSRLTLSRDAVESRCEVRRGDFGWLVSWPSCAPSPAVRRGKGGAFDV